MSRALSALMPAHSELLDVVAEQLARDRAEVEPLQGQPRLVRIAQWNRELALGTNAFLAALEEADPEAALNVLDHLALQLRSARLDALSSECGVVK